MTHAKWAHGTCLFFLVVVDRNWECEKKETKSPVNQRKDCLIYFVLLFIPTQTKIQTLTYWQLSSEFGHSSKQNAKEKLPSSRKRKKRKDKYSTSLPPAFCMPNNSKRNNLKKKKEEKAFFSSSSLVPLAYHIHRQREWWRHRLLQNNAQNRFFYVSFWFSFFLLLPNNIDIVLHMITSLVYKILGYSITVAG